MSSETLTIVVGVLFAAAIAAAAVRVWREPHPQFDALPPWWPVGVRLWRGFVYACLAAWAVIAVALLIAKSGSDTWTGSPALAAIGFSG